MSMTYVQQTIWAKQMIALLRGKLVGKAICNDNLVKGNGDEWRIILAGEVSSTSYSDSVDITYNETSDSEAVVIPNIDQVAAMLIKDTDLIQSDIDWRSVMATRATYVLLKDLDTGILGVYDDAGADSFEDGSSTAWQFTVSTAADIPKFFAALTKQADDLDWPDEGRYIVAPSGFREALNLYFGSLATTLGDETIRNGVKQGVRVLGWEVFISNNLTSADSVTHGLAGIKGDGIALGMQVDPNSVETMRAEGRYGDLVRSRVRGAYKVYRDTTLIDVNFNETVVATS